MQFLLKKLQEHRLVLVRLTTALLLVVSILSPIYFLNSYFKENSSGFHGGGYDFLAFYSAGVLASQGNYKAIYDDENLRNIQKEIIPENNESQGFMTYLNPPYFAYLLSPLTLLKIGDAQLVWLLITLILAMAVAYIISSRVDGRYNKLAVFIITISLFPFWQNYRQGQLGILLLFFTVLGILQYQKGKHRLSGALLSILFIKPHLALFALAGLIVYKNWKVIYGMITTVIITVSVFLPVTGVGVYVDYFRHLQGVTGSHSNGAGAVAPAVWEGSLGRSYGINGAVTKLVGQDNYMIVNIISLVIILLLASLIIRALFRKNILAKDSKSKYLTSVLVLFGILINIHLYAYDLAYLLAIPLIVYSKRIPKVFMIIFLFVIQISAVDYVFYIPLFTILITCLLLTYWFLIDKKYSLESKL